MRWYNGFTELSGGVVEHMDKRFLAILGVIVVVFGGILFINNRSQTTVTANPTNNVMGKLDSKVTLVEYGDFQCPACQTYSATTEAVRAKYADRVKFQFRNLPIPSLHPNAIGAARAAEAAALQNKFWEMHDLLYKYSNWSVWTNATDPNSNFESYARQLSLDVTKFKTDFKSEKVNATINADMAEFDKTGAAVATPTYFLNGKKIDSDKLADTNGPSVDKFSTLLDQALADAEK